jgi:hypothetical protein
MGSQRMSPFLSEVTLLHFGDQHGVVHVWILVGIGIVANVLFYAASGFGFLARHGIVAAAADAGEWVARIGKVVLPVRQGGLSLEGVELSPTNAAGPVQVIRIAEGTAELRVAGLLREEVVVPRVALSGIEVHMSPTPVEPGLELAEDPPPSAGPPGRDEAEAGGRRYRLSEVLLSGIVVHPGGGVEPVQVDDVRLTDVGLRPRSGGSDPGSATSGAALQEMIHEILSAVLAAAARVPPARNRRTDPPSSD